MMNQHNDDQRLKQLVANWINGTNTFEDVQYLEEGVKSKLRRASNSILRKFYSIVLQTKAHTLSDDGNDEKMKRDILSSLYRTYIMMTYEVGRSKDKKNDYKGDPGLKWLSKIMEYSIDELEEVNKKSTDVETLNQSFRNFAKIMEAIVAFHKLHGKN